MPNRFRSHSESRKVVCVICFSKGHDLRRISSRNSELIRKFALPDFDEEDPSFPNVICASCRICLAKTSEDDPTVKLNIYDRRNKNLKPVSTRQRSEEDKCECDLCVIARSNINTPLNNKKPAGRPPKESTSDDNSFTSVTSSIKLCSKCFTTLARGMPHHCSTGQKYSNVNSLMSKNSPEDPEKFCASVISSKLNHRSSGNIDLQSAKKCITLSVNCKESNEVLNAKNVIDIQRDMNLSHRNTLRITQHVRTATGSRSSVEPYIKQKLQLQDHHLDDHFYVEDIDFIPSESRVGLSSANNSIQRPVVLCRDIDQFIETISSIRGLNLNDEDILIKIGMDSGGGFFKIALSILSTKMELTNDQQENEDASAFRREEKLSGVKRTFVVAITPDVPENYVNLKKLWIHTGLHELKFRYFICADLKICNIFLGLMSHGSLHPCSWCNVNKNNLADVGESRSSGSLRDSFWSFFDSGESKSKAKTHGNVIHPPLLHKEQQGNVIDVIPPPELHLLIGSFTTLFKHLESKSPQTAQRWLRECHITKDEYHGGTFAGNNARALLKKVDLLASFCSLDILPNVEAFRTLNHVVHSCFGNDLNPNYKLCIKKFFDSCLSLDINITPKLHSIFHHVPEFCDKFDKGLGLFSEQSFESLHHNFQQTWNNYKVNNLRHPSYGERLLRAVSTFNSRHI